MMKPVYISSASIVSPQQHYEQEGFLDKLKSTDDGILYINEPNYRQYINPVAIRRMSKLLKMGISAGMNALKQAGVEKPDAIIAGTGRGSMVDTEQFLLDMIHMEEEALTPTSFIQSTYNSVNGWLALQTKSNGYNQTYVNRGTSLELALFDAQMFLNEAIDTKYVLAGSIDEITPDYVKVKQKTGYWKQPLPNSLKLLQHADTPGTVAGEGASFFTLSNCDAKALCKMSSIHMLQDAGNEEILTNIQQALSLAELQLHEIDVLLCGMNGDVRQQEIYDILEDQVSSNSTIAAFKHLCGEYDTSSGFAIWVATKLFETQQIPETLVQKKGTHSKIRNILIVNHYILNSTSIILLQSSK